MTDLLDVPSRPDPTEQPPPAALPVRRRNSRRSALLVAGLALVGGAVAIAGGLPSLNPRGLPVLADALGAAADPARSSEFLRRTLDAALTTAAFALVGTALALLVGIGMGVLISRRVRHRRADRRWRVSRGSTNGLRSVLALPRAVHEVVFALLLVRVLGLDPIVGILAIAVPASAFTAYVVADLLDDADPAPFLGLRAGGASRVAATAYGLAPLVRGPFVAYAFYRLECSLRSAAVLGIIGAGGLGTELILSLQSLRFAEVWTLTAALVLLALGLDRWSHAVRSGSDAAPGVARIVSRWSPAAVVALAVAGWWWLSPGVGRLVSARSADLAAKLVQAAVPPDLGGLGVAEVGSAAAVTVAAAVLATVLSVIVAAVLAPLSTRGAFADLLPQWGRRLLRVVSPTVRLALAFARSVPPPVLALFAVFVLRPGVWPAAVALGIGNAGVLARLVADELSEIDRRPVAALTASGAPAVASLAYAVVPRYSARLVSLAGYRFDVVLRDTIVVGIVASGGLGQLLDEALSSFAFATVLGIILTLVAVALVADELGSRVRASLR